MNAATPRAAVEGGKVVPDRSFTQGLVRHPGHEKGRGEAVPLDVHHSTGSWGSKVESEFKTSSAGTKSHAIQSSSSASALPRWALNHSRGTATASGHTFHPTSSGCPARFGWMYSCTRKKNSRMEAFTGLGRSTS